MRICANRNEKTGWDSVGYIFSVWLGVGFQGRGGVLHLHLVCVCCVRSSLHELDGVCLCVQGDAL